MDTTNQKHKEVLDKIGMLANYDITMLDTQDWSKEKLQAAYRYLIMFIGSYDHVYDLYDAMRQEKENIGLSQYEEELYNHLLDDIADEILTFEEEFSRKHHKN